jgi:diguanylate cyclase (GGDEF)-like protein
MAAKGASGASPPGQLERELAYYRRECNDLGARLLRLQEEQSEAFREARRSRTVAKLIREASRLADTGIAPDALGEPMLEIIVDNAMCDRAALLLESPLGSGRFTTTHVIGVGEPSPSTTVIQSPPPFFFTTAETRLEPPAYELIAILQLPYVLWAYDQSTGSALIIGNRSQANVNRPFGPGDQELIEGGLSVYLDVLARRRAEVALRHQAYHDALTKLPNRLQFHERLDRALVAASSGGGRLALLILDLDGFKAVNDTFGHEAGDGLLCDVARRLSELLPEGVLLSRLGGDEFILLASDVPHRAAASSLGDLILAAFGQPFTVEAEEVQIGVSVGISLLPDDGTARDQLLRAADLALYQAKAAGRSAVVHYQREMGAQLDRRRRLGLELRQAVATKGIGVVFQPIVTLGDRSVSGFETLARWNHGGLGEVPPAEFIPTAEATGLIRPLGLHVMREACRQIAALHERGRRLEVTVNISAVQLRDKGFVHQVMAALEQAGLPAGSLCLELTESQLIDPHDREVQDVLKSLTRREVRIAIDDFGTGFSSLVGLRLLPIHVIKIDTAFVAGLGRDAAAEAIVAATVGLARELGKLVTAEGVETEEQHRFLAQLGCDRAQGDLYGRPADLAQHLEDLSGSTPAALVKAGAD